MPFVCPVCRVYVSDRRYNLSRHAVSCAERSTSPFPNLQAAIEEAIGTPVPSVVRPNSQPKSKDNKASSSSKPPPTTTKHRRGKLGRKLPSESELAANLPLCMKIPGNLDDVMGFRDRPQVAIQTQPENPAQHQAQHPAQHPAQPPHQEQREARFGPPQQAYTEKRPQTPNQVYLEKSGVTAPSVLPRSPTPSKSSNSLTLCPSSSSPVSPVSAVTIGDMESRSPSRNHPGDRSTSKQMLFNRTPFKARKKEIKRSLRCQDSHITLTLSPSFFPATEVDSQIQDLQFGYRLLRYELYEITKINNLNQETIVKLCDTIQQLIKK